MKLILAVIFVSLTLAAFSAEDADAVYKQGVDALRKAQSDHSALVPATKLLAKAAALYETAGNEAKVQEVNSCLYWAKKKMTLADTELIKTNQETSKRLDAVIQEAAKNNGLEDAKNMLAKADSFAKAYPSDNLLIAIRYFEIADRFRDNEYGRKAMDSSLKAMQNIKMTAKSVENPKPAERVDPKIEIVGKWEMTFVNSTGTGIQIVEFMKDGSAKVKSSDTGAQFDATWKCDSGVFSLKTFRSTSKLVVKGDKFEGKSTDGGTRTGVRISQ